MKAASEMSYMRVGTETPFQDTDRIEWEKKLKLGPRKVLCLKGFNDDWRDEKGNVLLYRATYGNTASKEYTHTCEILAVGDGCKILSQTDVGSWIVGPERHTGWEILGDGYIVFDERLIDDGVVLPYVIQP